MNIRWNGKEVEEWSPPLGDLTNPSLRPLLEALARAEFPVSILEDHVHKPQNTGILRAVEGESITISSATGEKTVQMNGGKKLCIAYLKKEKKG